MSTAPVFPNDENGNVLRQQYENGDDLSKPRLIDFNFVFPERKQAIAFAEIVEEKDLQVCISYYEERTMWQAIVKRFMVPSHRAISETEANLAAKAKSVGGEADGWGCMQIDREKS